MNEQAELLFTEIWWRTIARFSDIVSFRNLTMITLPHIKEYVTNEKRYFVHSLAYDRQYDNIFIDKEGFFNIVGGIDALAAMLSEQKIQSYQAAIDSASIVLAHSALDAAAFDYFMVIELIAPLHELEIYVNKKQITLEKLKGNSYDEIVREKIREFINDLDRKSLLDKIDKMFQICQPPPKYSPIEGYIFDKEKIKSLDKLRHEIVHGAGISAPLTNFEEDIKYMQDTGNFLMTLIYYKYDIKLNPTVLKESQKKKIKK